MEVEGPLSLCARLLSCLRLTTVPCHMLCVVSWLLTRIRAVPWVSQDSVYFVCCSIRFVY